MASLKTIVGVASGVSALGHFSPSLCPAVVAPRAPYTKPPKKSDARVPYFASDGCPPGCRIIQLPSDAVAKAMDELDENMDESQGAPQEKLELQWGYFAVSKGGLLRRKRSLSSFPACATLVREANKIFGLESKDEERVQVVVRRYWDGMQCLGHVDSVEFFEEPNLFIVLKTGGPPDGLRLYEKATKTEYLVNEAPGVSICLEGPSRYETFHSVPKVLNPRVSLTWRWYHEDVLERLKLKAGLQ
eukprot:TRINITY_DN48832_c0_g1_i1.p1 TRINITY_DN48832_c0_g1~~TRINITY_DN48832_c0_g1_i1.p1  ORF type:complete len:271 (-),score=46.72 TRINITY_DN48832_c0_g1_i1:28-762(-)